MCVCVQSPLGVYSCMRIEGMTVFRAEMLELKDKSLKGVCMCMSVVACVHMCVHVPLGSRRRHRSPDAGVACGCEPPDVGPL